MTTVFGSSLANGETRRSGPSGGASSAVGSQFWNREQSALFETWASSFEQFADSYPSPYFDYFFTGQDIRATIEGLEDDEPLPLYTMGFMIEQQKMPVYGFWSFTYDAMLRGTRIVSGAFSMATKQPALLTSQIAKAASIRSIRAGNRNRMLRPLRTMGDDEANIKEFWHRNYDNNLDTNQQHLFSIHPPFNIILRYGLQETSLTSNNPDARVAELRYKFSESTPMATDINERLVRNPSVQEDYQLMVENVEIVNMAIQVDNEGNPLLETYSFLARDIRQISSAAFSNPSPLRSSSGSRPSGQTPN